MSRDGQPVDDATVEVNGINLSLVSGGAYMGQLASTLSPNDILNLNVEIGNTVITGRGSLPVPADVQEPDGSIPLSAAAAIIVDWVALGIDPSRFTVRAECTTCTDTYFNSPVGSARSHTIPPNTLEAGNTYKISVTAYNNGTFTGAHDDASRMNISNTGQTVMVSITP